MTGRARGRARGRRKPVPPEEVRRPGEPDTPVPLEQKVGVGGRGRAIPKVTSVPSTQLSPLSQSMQPLLQQMGKVQITQEPIKEPPKPVLSREATPTVSTKQPTKELTPPAPGASIGRSAGRGYSEPFTRPEHIVDKCGISGTQIRVVSNFVALKNRPDCALYQYNVSYSPIIESKRLRLKLLYEQEVLIGKTRAFDGMVLYLPKRLPDDVVEYTSKLNDGSFVKVTITLTNEVSANSPVCIQLFNIIFRRILGHLGMTQIGRHFYNAKLPIKVPQHKLELWPGYITSILQYEDNVMLCADISHKILRIDTVWDLLNEIFSKKGNFHDNCAKALIGEIILTRYNNKTYRIDDINWQMSPQASFKLSNGEETTFREYYSKAYNMDINDLEQPLLVSQPKKREIRARGGDDSPILLVPELCTCTGLSDDARADYRVMKDLVEHTSVAPKSRNATLKKFLNQIKTMPKCVDELSGWNLEFDDNLAEYNARILPQEKIFQKNSTLNYVAHEADWSKGMRGNILISPIHLKNFNIYVNHKDESRARDFFVSLKKVCPPMGINVGEPLFKILDNDRTDSFIKAMSADLSRNNQVQMVIVILPTNRKDRYDAIKKLCCKHRDDAPPVLSQCILSRTLSKPQTLMSVTTKVAMQLNCKMGGELWALEIPLKNCMVIGVDTYHDSSRRGRSVGGFIASMNATLTKYHSQAMHQSTGQELADNLKVCMSRALRQYHEVNRRLPERIILFRDGVGDGQLAAVVEHEIPQIMSAFAVHENGYEPKFAVVVVKKRISARIFGKHGGGLTNPPPGTIVDNTITKPEWYDFFLVSQSVRHGTVTPTHFNVVYDTSQLKPDHMQRLTYKLCHLYYNWAGTVRVPAPCQYAHKLAFLVGQSVHELPSKLLDDKLYYL